uniref:Starch synthase catalytic domain-containing protein n=1 Tax=Tetradesmus obliquus TaxID=3088 RepID=A0A383W6Y1_TETOB|eukprot:jgi/Sobl393_1/10864/SZX72953.1
MNSTAVNGSLSSCRGKWLNRSTQIVLLQRCVRVQRSQLARHRVRSAAASQLQVVFVTTEVAPWSKVGGLGDVMAALPAALAARGHRVMTVSPMYSNYSDVRDTGVRAPVQMPLDTAAAAAAAEQQQQLKQLQAERRQLQQQQQLLGPPDAPGWRRASSVYSSMDEAGDADQAAPAAVARAAAVYSSMDEASEEEQAVEPAAAPAGENSSDAMDGNYVHYYMCTSCGVDRVFVDHPLYHGGSDRGSGTPWTSAVVSTYCHPDSEGAAAGGANPDLAAAASVLCQAALAAPLLLWGVGGGLDGQQEQQQRQERKWQQHQRQQQLEMLLLLKLLGLEQSQAAAEAAAATAAAGGGVAALLSAAAQQQQAALLQGLRHPQQIVAGRAQPVLLGTGGSEVDRRWPVSDLLLPQGAHGSSSEDSAAAGLVVFVGNDWPCGVLPLWLDTYRQEAQQQWQQHNPHLDWLLQQQQDLFHLHQQQLVQQQLQQQQQQQQHWQQQQQHQHQASRAERLVQAALQACSSSSSTDSAGSTGLSLPGSNAAAGVFGEYAAVYVNGSHLASPAVQPQQLLQELQEGWQREAAGTQPGHSCSRGPQQQPGHSCSRGPQQQPGHSCSRGPQQQWQAQQAPAGAGASYEEPAVAPGDSSSWSAAAESWLQAAGYQPGSVYRAELSALVQDAVAAGRVAPAVLPALSAAQGQLQQLLQQEQELGEAIEELLAAARLQQQQQQQQQEVAVVSIGSSSGDLGPAAAAAAAASGGSRTLAQVGSGPGRPGSPLALSHKQELALLQQLVGRQLAGSKVALAVHNFGYQGGFTGRRHFERLGLPRRLLPSFAAPVALAAKAASAVGRQVGSKVAAAAAGAASAVGSQLAALGEALQRLGRPKQAGGANGSSGSSYGLLASMQEMLVQASVQAAEQQAGLEQQEQQQGLEQQEQQQQQESVAVCEGAAGEAQDGVVAGGSSVAQQQRYYHHLLHTQQLPDEVLQPGARPASPDSLQLNWLAAGLSTSDAAITVSPNYAQEMLLEEPRPAKHSSSNSSNGSGRPGSPSGASPGLAALLASRQLRGIMNGLDTAFWDPAADPLLPAAVRYSAATVGPGKAAAKALLQRRLGLAPDPSVPLFGFVGRLTYQKGVDVILAALPQLMAMQQRQTAAAGAQQSAAGSSAASAPPAGTSRAGPGLQLVLLGAGEPWMEAVLGQLGGRYPGAAAGVPAFNEPLAHLLLAGADFLLVPSRYEPCGLVALAGLRYGAVPLAAATGGLADIVSPAVGYSLASTGPEGDTAGFRRGVADLAAAMSAAAADYGTPAHEARRAAAMAADVSWEAPCSAWEQLLLQLADQPAGGAAEAAAAAAVGDAAAVDGPVGGGAAAAAAAAAPAAVRAETGVAASARHDAVLHHL